MAKQPADRIRRIEKEVCRDLDCKPDDEICRHVTTLRLMRENMQAKLVLGERVDPSDLLAVDAAIKQYLPQGRAGPCLRSLHQSSACPNWLWHRRRAAG